MWLIGRFTVSLSYYEVIFMMNFLMRKCIKNSEDVNNPSVRAAYGKFAGIIGIISNLVLFVLKFVLGIISGCISITADAINNLSDMGSSLITVLGFKLSSKEADEKHPFGHERIEYIAGLIVSIVIIVIGIELGRSSIDKIIHPGEIEFSYLIVGLLAAAILIKFWQGFFYRRVGKKINSVTLMATMQDSINDCITTFVVLVGLVISHLIKFNLDGYFGVFVSIFIIYSGIKLVKETTDPLIGMAPDPELTEQIVSKVLSYDEIYGIHDMVCHMYGQSNLFITMHCEVDSKIPVMESHELIDTVERDIKEAFHCEITIHLDPIEIGNSLVDEVKEKVKDIIYTIDPALLFHDFRMVVGVNQTNIIFDIVVPFNCKLKTTEIEKIVCEKVKEIDPKYNCVITFDKNYVG